MKKVEASTELTEIESFTGGLRGDTFFKVARVQSDLSTPGGNTLHHFSDVPIKLAEEESSRPPPGNPGVEIQRLLFFLYISKLLTLHLLLIQTACMPNFARPKTKLVKKYLYFADPLLASLSSASACCIALCVTCD